ncbi:helix-turn-helix transcriptional regulator [Epilithonimonas tenax]|uniref:helix-turn-helix transcriptional regulator n=1 Tax=Epilithonimonas tenax TaxID=191577 RepID=UPI0003F520C1|nr:helix-turn-helix transcriptional regulator [Epilithonimonas tenax]
MIFVKIKRNTENSRSRKSTNNVGFLPQKHKFVKNTIMAIGTNLKKFRSKTKFSQQEIADMLGLDRSTYINWENETSDIKSQYLPKLADIFGVEIQDLFLDDQKVRISNNTFDNKDNSTGIIIFNFTNKEMPKEVEELIKSLKK